MPGLCNGFSRSGRIGVEPDRERRIHRARHAAIARETAILSAQHLHRFDYQRRLATLVVFAREMEAELTDAALTMQSLRLLTARIQADDTEANPFLKGQDMLLAVFKPTSRGFETHAPAQSTETTLPA